MATTKPSELWEVLGDIEHSDHQIFLLEVFLISSTCQLWWGDRKKMSSLWLYDLFLFFSGLPETIHHKLILCFPSTIDWFLSHLLRLKRFSGPAAFILNDFLTLRQMAGDFRAVRLCDLFNSTGSWWAPWKFLTLLGQDQKCNNALTAVTFMTKWHWGGWGPGRRDYWNWNWRSKSWALSLATNPRVSGPSLIKCG